MLDCESRDSVLVEIRSRNSFYGHPFPSASCQFLAKECNYLGGYLEQCRSVNPFIRTGVFNPFKMTERFVIIGSVVTCNGSDIYPFTENVVSYKRTV